METFSALQWRGALVFSLICVWINGWVNNGEAGDLRRYRAHYDVTVMNILINTNRLNVDKVFPKRHQLCLFLCLPNTLFQIVSSRRMWYLRTYILTLSRLLQNRTPSPPDTLPTQALDQHILPQSFPKLTRIPLGKVMVSWKIASFDAFYITKVKGIPFGRCRQATAH